MMKGSSVVRCIWSCSKYTYTSIIICIKCGSLYGLCSVCSVCNMYSGVWSAEMCMCCSDVLLI